MADKVIKLKIDLNKITKAHLFTGKKGALYLDMTLLYQEEDDRFGNNGMIVQDVPSAKWKEDHSLRGEILGNAKVWNKESKDSDIAKPGEESGELVGDSNLDDLPF